MKDKFFALYRQIRSFECIPGCTDCCGPVPFARWEWERVKDKKKGTSIKCPYATDTGCEIYEVRPFMCRLFGTVDDPRLKCPYGRRPKHLLTAKKAQKLTQRYKELI